LDEGKTPPLTLAPEESPDEATMRALDSGLDAHTARLGFRTDWSQHWIIGRDTGGAVQAGIRFALQFDWLFLQALWVAEPYRSQGIGSRLLVGAEAAARDKGCRAAFLSTFTFQAPKFYDRHGYREFGRLNDFPLGHAAIWLWKPL
jgi:GNAT superfamily N-acetyltransferase